MAKRATRKKPVSPEETKEGLSRFQQEQLRAAKAYLRRMTEITADPDTVHFDLELSQKFSKGAKLKACFENCYRLFLYPENTEFPFNRAKYVEGYIWYEDGPQLTIHHAWIELDDKVIDPTRIVLAKRTKAVLNLHYKAKRRVTRKTLMTAIADGRFPLWSE